MDEHDHASIEDRFHRRRSPDIAEFGPDLNRLGIRFDSARADSTSPAFDHEYVAELLARAKLHTPRPCAWKECEETIAPGRRASTKYHHWTCKRKAANDRRDVDPQKQKRYRETHAGRVKAAMDGDPGFAKKVRAKRAGRAKSYRQRNIIDLRAKERDRYAKRKDAGELPDPEPARRAKQAKYRADRAEKLQACWTTIIDAGVGRDCAYKWSTFQIRDWLAVHHVSPPSQHARSWGAKTIKVVIEGLRKHYAKQDAESAAAKATDPAEIARKGMDERQAVVAQMLEQRRKQNAPTIRRSR